MGTVEVIIAGGGMGVRFGAEMPKQFINIGGKPTFLHSIEKFAACESVRGITVVVPQEWVSTANDILEKHKIAESNINVRINVIAGGGTRQQSVFIGLEHICANVGNEFSGVVLIHDAARPFITHTNIIETINLAEKHGAAILCSQVNDTVKLYENEENINKNTDVPTIHKTLDRERLLFAQTPQGFKFDIIYKAHKKALDDKFCGTDDSSLVERIGIYPIAVKGGHTNIKITSAKDLQYAEFLYNLQLKNF